MTYQFETVEKFASEKYTTKYKKSFLPSSHEEYKPLHLGTNYNKLGRWKDKMLESNTW